jgi:hypothetical protein
MSDNEDSDYDTQNEGSEEYNSDDELNELIPVIVKKTTQENEENIIENNLDEENTELYDDDKNDNIIFSKEIKTNRYNHITKYEYSQLCCFLVKMLQENKIKLPEDKYNFFNLKEENNSSIYRLVRIWISKRNIEGYNIPLKIKRFLYYQKGEEVYDYLDINNLKIVRDYSFYDEYDNIEEELFEPFENDFTTNLYFEKR